MIERSLGDVSLTLSTISRSLCLLSGAPEQRVSEFFSNEECSDADRLVVVYVEPESRVMAADQVGSKSSPLPMMLSQGRRTSVHH